jgi:hypothetical protein
MALPVAVHAAPLIMHGSSSISQPAGRAEDSWGKPRNAAKAPLASSVLRKNERRPDRMELWEMNAANLSAKSHILENIVSFLPVG